MANMDKPRRRSRRRFLGELYVKLRLEGGSPVRQAAAVGLGVWIGCFPLYGLHLALCFLAARLFGLNRLTTYLGAHVSNPLTAGPLLLLEYGAGHFVMDGRWSPHTPASWTGAGVLSIGGELLVGCLIVGTGLAVLCTLVAYRLARPWRMAADRKAWLDRAASLYLKTGVANWEFVRAKIRHDPLYFWLLDPGRLPGTGRLVDLGCGRGIVLALLLTSTDHADRSLSGVEGRARTAATARAVLGDRADIELADLRSYVPTACRVALLIDVLHYLDAATQERLLHRVREALEPGGTLLIREPDDRPFSRFLVTRAAERARALLRGDWRQRFHYRGGAAWCELLGGLGFEVSVVPMNQRTPFSNLVIEGRLPLK